MAQSLSIMEQIQIMLAKAETTTPAEAEMITKRAERLMVRHGLTEAMLAAASPEAKKEAIVQKTRTYSDTYGVARKTMVNYITQAFGTLAALQASYGKNHTAYVVGHESDVDNALILIDSLMVQADRALKEWWAREGKELQLALGTQGAWKARRQFYLSFAGAVARRIRETTKSVVSEESAPGAALALVDRGQVVKDYVDSRYRVSAAKGRGFQTNYAGAAAGRAAGERAVINRSIDR